MTTERAIEILDPTHREHYDSLETVKEACRMGMTALEKQMPRKIIPVTMPDNKTITGYKCPNCKDRLFIGNKFCPNCGQALDWEAAE